MYRAKTAAILLHILALLIILSGCNILNKNYKPGYWNNNTFIHKWADIQFKLPEGFTIANKEQLESYILNNPNTVIASPNTNITEATSIIEFLAIDDYQDLSLQKTIILVIENLNALNIKNEDEYIEYQKQLTEAIGINYFLSEKQNTKIGGKTFTYIDTVLDSVGLNMIARTCFRFKGDYAIVIQVFISGSSYENEIDALMKSFS